MRILIPLLLIALVLTFVLLSMRFNRQVDAAPVRPAIGDVRWRAGHTSRDGITQVVVRREVASTGQVIEERRVATVPDDDPDYDAKFAEAVALARARAELYDVEER